MKHILYIISCLLFAFPMNALAVSCYSQNEARAEQLLRLHSELLVIGLNCQHRPNLRHVYSGYQAFTQKHSYLISNAENTMERYLNKTGGGNVHNYRTNLVNDVAHDASIRPDAFCQVYGPRIDFARKLAQNDVLIWANKYPVSKPVCR